MQAGRVAFNYHMQNSYGVIKESVIKLKNNAFSINIIPKITAIPMF